MNRRTLRSLDARLAFTVLRRGAAKSSSATMVLFACAALISACDMQRNEMRAEWRASDRAVTLCDSAVPPHNATEGRDKDGVALVVVPDMEPVCEAQLVSLLELQPPDDDIGLLPGRSLAARRSDGLYVTAIIGENALAVWDTAGRFVQRIGRSGAGPGEFASLIQPVFGAGDTLWTIDNARQLNIFDENFKYVRRSLQMAANVSPGYWFVTHDGRRFVSPPPAGVRSHHVAELDTNGEVRRLLVPANPETTGPGLPEAERALAYGEGSAFWIGPTQVPAQSYEMEQWSLDGRLLRRVRRDAEWFVPYVLNDEPDSSAEPYTYFSKIQVDSDGFLHTVISSRERREPLPPGTVMTRELRKQGATVRYEIMDPTSGTLIASERFADADSVPRPFIPRTNTAIILVSDTTYDYKAHVVRWQLSPRLRP